MVAAAVAFSSCSHARSLYWTFQNELAVAPASAQFASSNTPTSAPASTSASRFAPQPRRTQSVSPWTRRLSTSLRTPHITPIPIHEEHGNELERAQAPRIVTSFSSRCLSALNAGLFFAIVILSGCPLSRPFSYQVNEGSPPFEQLDPPWRCTTTTSMVSASSYL